MTSHPTITHDEYATRRESLRRELGRSIGLVFAGEQLSPDLPFRPHAHFEYLTGVTDEPGAVLMLDPSNPVKSRREMLFLKPLNPEQEKWEGYRLEISAALRQKVGVETVFRLTHMPRFLTQAAARCRSLGCLHPLATYEQPVSPDLALFKKVAERIPGVSIEDRSDVLAGMRAIKSEAEVAMIQRAVDITAKGFDAAIRAIRPGMNEFDVQEVIEHAYRTNGARETAFATIAGAGVNTTVLHYHANDQQLHDGELILIDSGAAYGGYRGDITRTYPVNGKFSQRQREIYSIVLGAQEAAIQAIRPGATLADIHKAALTMISKAGYADAFIHSTSHHLGLETHDSAPDEPLKAGAVITVEPGIYLPHEKIGVRIEDDVLVTTNGAEVLSSAIPKTVEEIENIMAG